MHDYLILILELQTFGLFSVFGRSFEIWLTDVLGTRGWMYNQETYHVKKFLSNLEPCIVVVRWPILMFNVQLYVYILWQHQYNSKNHSYLSGTYYIEDIEGVIQTTERTGTIISHKGFPSQPYGRRISASLRITGLKSNVAATVLFVKFNSKFDVFASYASDTRKNCKFTDDNLYIGNEGSQTYSRYWNNERPALDVWIPHAVYRNRFIFQFTLSTTLPSTAMADGFHLQYSGE